LTVNKDKIEVVTHGTVEVKIDAKFLVEELIKDVRVVDGVIVGYR